MGKVSDFRQKKTVLATVAIFGMVLFGLVGCNYRTLKGVARSSPVKETSASPVLPAANAGALRGTFSSIYSHILERRCNGCHRAGGEAEDYAIFTSYAGVKDFVEAGNPGGSLIYLRMRSQSMPPKRTGMTVSAAELQVVASWIENNALEN